jgi:hypothetical protein
MKKQLFTLCLMLLSFWVVAQPPVLPIDSIQFMNAGRLSQVKFNVSGQDSTLPDYIRPVFKNTRYQDTVTIEGIVTFEPSSYALSTSRTRKSAFLQVTDGRSWCGIEVMMDTSQISPTISKSAFEAASQFTQNMKLGRKVRVTGLIRHFQNNSQLLVLPVPTQVISIGNTIKPQVVNLEDIMKNNQGSQEPQFSTGEQWEGVYVEIKNVSVANSSLNGQRWTWSVQDAQGNQLNIRDVSGYYRNDNNDDDNNTPRNFTPPAVGGKLAYIRGVITESGNFGSKRYNIAPLYPSDLAPPAAEPPVVSDIKVSPVIIDPTTDPVISATITDDTAVASATLYYAVGYGSTNFTPVAMTASGSTYSASVPAQNAGTIVKYYIRAVDNGGNFVDVPDSLALSSAYKVVNGINSVKDIQETPYSNGGSLYVNDTLKNINVSGVIVSTNGTNDLGLITLQSGNAPWGGIFIRPTIGDGTSQLKRGDSIVITEALVTERRNQGSDPFGRLVNNFGTTFLENVKFTKAGSCSAMPIITNLTIDSILSSTFNKEPYESSMIGFTNVTVVSQNPDAPSNFGEFLINTDPNASTGLRGENFSSDLGFTFNTDSIALNEQLSVFQGPLVFAFGNWKVFPRNRTDVGKAGDLIAPHITKLGADTITIIKGQTYTDPGATACDDVDGDISANVVINTSSVDNTTAGTYTVTMNVSDAANNPAIPVTRTVIVQDNVGLAELGKTISLGLYPVPTGNSLTVNINSNYSDIATINVIDITGKVVLTKEVNFEAGNNAIELSTSQLKNGIYFCNFSNKSFSTTQKFVVIK